MAPAKICQDDLDELTFSFEGGPTLNFAEGWPLCSSDFGESL